MATVANAAVAGVAHPGWVEPAIMPAPPPLWESKPSPWFPFLALTQPRNCLQAHRRGRRCWADPKVPCGGQSDEEDHEYEEQPREKAAVVPATCGASRDPRAIRLVASELMRVIVPAPSKRSKGVGSA